MTSLTFLERRAVRAIVLTPDEEILLMRIHAPESLDHFWIASGGGLNEGESAEVGLRRELYEELGLVTFDIGPTVWLRHHTFNWGDKRISQREEYRIVHTARFEPKMSDLVEAKVLDRFQWWRIADLASCKEPLTPRTLPTILSNYLRHGAPKDPLEVERLID